MARVVQIWFDSPLWKAKVVCNNKTYVATFLSKPTEANVLRLFKEDAFRTDFVVSQ